MSSVRWANRDLAMARNSSVDSSLSAAALRPLVGPESSPKRPQKMSWCLQVRGSHSEAVLEPVHFVAVASAGADLWRIFAKPETGQALAESGLERGWGVGSAVETGGEGPSSYSYSSTCGHGQALPADGVAVLYLESGWSFAHAATGSRKFSIRECEFNIFTAIIQVGTITVLYAQIWSLRVPVHALYRVP